MKLYKVLLIFCKRLIFIKISIFHSQITQSLNFWVRKACEIETNAVSIERVCEYENMDKEVSTPK